MEEKRKTLAEKITERDEERFIPIDRAIHLFKQDPRTIGIYITNTVNEYRPRKKCIVKVRKGRLSDLAESKYGERMTPFRTPEDMIYVTGYEIQDGCS